MWGIHHYQLCVLSLARVLLCHHSQTAILSTYCAGTLLLWRHEIWQCRQIWHFTPRTQHGSHFVIRGSITVQDSKICYSKYSGYDELQCVTTRGRSDRYASTIQIAWRSCLSERRRTRSRVPSPQRLRSSYRVSESLETLQIIEVQALCVSYCKGSNTSRGRRPVNSDQHYVLWLGPTPVSIDIRGVWKMIVIFEHYANNEEVAPLRRLELITPEGVHHCLVLTSPIFHLSDHLVHHIKCS